MMDITPKELCDLELFVSQAHARRVIAQADESWTMMMSLQERMIEAQRKRIAELEAAQRWIPVGEWETTDGVDVLGISGRYGTMAVVSYDEGRWVDSDYFEIGVTHVRPLPEPPKLEDAP